MKNILKIITSFLIITIPDLVQAQTRPIERIFTEGIIPEPSGGTGENTYFEIIDVFTLLGNVLTLIFTFTAVIAIIYVIIGGYYYVTAYGNPENIQKGKQTITWAIIGLVVSMLAWAIVQFVWGAISGESPPSPTT